MFEDEGTEPWEDNPDDIDEWSDPAWEPLDPDEDGEPDPEPGDFWFETDEPYD